MNEASGIHAVPFPLPDNLIEEKQMKMKGSMYDADEEEVAAARANLALWMKDKPRIDVKDAIVNDHKIALDWHESGELFNAVLHSTNGGVHYEGHFGTPKPEEIAVIEAIRLPSKSGDVLLSLEWRRTDTGYGGVMFVRLTP